MIAMESAALPAIPQFNPHLAPGSSVAVANHDEELA